MNGWISAHAVVMHEPGTTLCVAWAVVVVADAGAVAVGSGVEGAVAVGGAGMVAVAFAVGSGVVVVVA